MQKITAEGFFEFFKNIVKEDIKIGDIKLIDIYHNWHDFTRYITRKINDILTQKYNLEFSNEYYNIDIIGWIQEKNKPENKQLKDEVQNKSLSFYLWKLNVVIEHENNKNEWIDELVKLYYIKCPLKIIITYNYCDKRDDGLYGDKEKVKIAKEVLLTLNNRKQLEEEYLIIIGNACAKDGSDVYSDFDYRGYLIKGELVEIYKILP